MDNLSRIPRIMAALQAVWLARPDTNLGALLEVLENQAWDMVEIRHTAPRLMHLPDEALESAIDLYIKANRITIL